MKKPPPPYCGGKPPDGVCQEAQFPLQPARRVPWKGLAAGFAISLVLTAAGMSGAAAGGDPEPLVRGQPLPEVHPPKDCAPTHELCVESHDLGDYDAKAGVAELRGDVRGYIRSTEMAFTTQRLKATRAAKGTLRRLELYGTVRVSEPGRRVAADNAVVDRGVSTLFGKVRMEEQGNWIECDEAVVDHDAERVTLKGKAGEPLTVMVSEDETDQPAGSMTKLADGTQVWAQRAVMEQEGRQLQLTGAVHVTVPLRQLVLDAENVTLVFTESGAVISFSARGNVRIVQPGRKLMADSARSQNRMQTILLLGKARMQQEGQFDLNSDRLEVYVDTQRGAVRSEDRQKPMNLSIDINAVRGWKLDASRMAKLRDQGVPSTLTRKLEVMQGRVFPSQQAFDQAVTERLGAEDADRYLPTINNVARP